MSAILPRPIAFVSTIGEDGVLNLAPYSCFAPVGMKPALVCLQVSLKRDGKRKDTLNNIEFSRDFVVNVVDETYVEAMNRTSFEFPSDVDEFREVGLTPVKSDLVQAPRLAESPVNLECKLVKLWQFGEASTAGHVVIGEIVLAHVKDELWTGDQIDISKWRPIGRLGGQLYCRVTDIFEMMKPTTS